MLQMAFSPMQTYGAEAKCLGLQNADAISEIRVVRVHFSIEIEIEIDIEIDIEIIIRRFRIENER